MRFPNLSFVKYILLVVILSNIDSFGQSTVILKGTDYALKLPKGYGIKRAQGVDYYSFTLSNSSTPDSLKTFLMFGCCVGMAGEHLNGTKKIDSFFTKILAQNIQWQIYDWNSTWLAEAIMVIDDTQKVVFGIRVKTRQEMDLLIDCFRTLRKLK